ncbi:MAG TPA: PhnD/SsuA/transferrin family substrate-binding protein [Aliidongia sp.]|nr:PhnD/SsuA/transferrin family substrate-binding protein [Aliidongia sp.]
MTDRLAALPMYDLAELTAANDAFWQVIRRSLEKAGLSHVPTALERAMPVEALWDHPRLLLAQSCGYPLRTSLCGHVRLVATPRYRAAGCSGARHRSALIVRAGDNRRNLEALRGSRCVANQPTSNTGMNLLRAAIAPLAGGRPFFDGVAWSGSHRNSITMVAEDEADLAAIDAVTLALLKRHEPDLVARVRILGWTASTAGLPFIAAGATDDATLRLLRETLLEVSTAPEAVSLRDELLLDGFEILSEQAYEEILGIERQAAELGYPTLQ